MREPTGPELQARVPALLPTRFQAEFDEDADLFTTDGEITRCGVLMALSWSFDRR